MKRKYVTRMFIMMTFLLIAIVLILSMMGFSFIRTQLINEVIKQNQLSLNQSARNVSAFLSDRSKAVELMAIDSEVIELLKEKQMDHVHEEDMIYTVEKILNEKLSTLYPNDVNLYHISYIPEHLAEHRYATKLGQAYLHDTDVDESQSSIYRYNFTLSKDVVDLITNRSFGHIQLRINELALMDYYSDLRTPKNDYYIVNRQGVMISNYKKDIIDKPYFKLDDKDFQSEFLTYSEEGNSYMVFFQQVPHTDWYAMSEVNESLIIDEASQVRWVILLVLAVSVIVIAILSIVFSKMIAKPIQYINGVLEEVSDGNLEVRAEFEEENEFSSIGESFNAMIAKIKDLLFAVKYQEQMRRLVEIDFLRAQINPHFIYNTLSSIRFYVEMNKTDEAEKMLMYFSDVLRKTLSRSDEMIELKDEISTLMSYVELQKLRYKDGFEVVYHFQDHLEEIWIPAFILQPMVENAIYYNMNANEKTVIQITATLLEDHLMIEIKDNGIGMSYDQIEEALKQKTNINKVGIKNVDERMKLIYGNQYGLQIESERGKGTTVRYQIPLKGKMPDLISENM